jgi:hypothetical protein
VDVVTSAGAVPPAVRGISGSTGTIGPGDVGKAVAISYSGSVALLLTDCSSGVVGGGGKLNRVTVIVATALTQMNLSLDSGISLNGGAWSPLAGFSVYDLVTGDGLNWIRSSSRDVDPDLLVRLLATGIEPIDVNGQEIVNAATPTTPASLATKAYVDFTPATDNGVSTTYATAIGDVGKPIKVRSGGATAVDFNDLSGSWPAGFHVGRIAFIVPAAVVLTVTPDTGVMINGSNSPIIEPAAIGVYEFISYDGLNWFH